jgi:nitronate monooxygenase
MTTGMSLCERIGIEVPIIQAPMAGSGTPELVAAVSDAGGLGMIGAAYLTPALLSDEIAAVRRLTDRPFGVNLFAGGRAESYDIDAGGAISIVTPFYEALELAVPDPPSFTGDPFASQLEVVLEAEIPVFSFTFGIPASTALQRLRERGTFVIGTATTVAEAKLLESAGIDAVVTQGSEAGAHRGTFAAPFEMAMIGTMALVPQVVDAIRIPVVASGGIMDGRGIVAAEALGAQAVQMGTAFLVCHEGGIPDSYKRAIAAAPGETTRITRAFSGRPARGIDNDFIRFWEGHEEAILPFPYQHALTRPLRSGAAARGDTSCLALWAGQGAALTRPLPAADLVRQLIEERDAIRARICQR